MKIYLNEFVPGNAPLFWTFDDERAAEDYNVLYTVWVGGIYNGVAHIVGDDENTHSFMNRDEALKYAEEISKKLPGIPVQVELCHLEEGSDEPIVTNDTEVIWDNYDTLKAPLDYKLDDYYVRCFDENDNEIELTDFDYKWDAFRYAENAVKSGKCQKSAVYLTDNLECIQTYE